MDNKRHAFGYHLRRNIRILAESVPAFLAAEGVLRAAALTYYTIFSIVPIFALLFGVAKGFGLEEWFKNDMLHRFQAHDEILKWLYDFANTTLHEARGGVVAGIGALLLCWTVIKMIGNIEKAFNRVWNVRRGRSIFRKFTDYLPIVIIAPVLILAAGSATFLVSSRLRALVSGHEALSAWSLPVIEFGVLCVPYLLNWVLFSFLYLILPNTRVRRGAAFFGGVIAGTLVQLLQNGYIYLQMALSNYNVIYGSFSVLPLFLIGVNLTWLIVLFGVNLSHLWQTFDMESIQNHDAMLGKADRRLLSLLVVAEVAHSFEAGEPPPTMDELAKRVKISRTMASRLLEKLIFRNVLIPVSSGEYEDKSYIPAFPLEKMTIVEVLRRLDDLGKPHIQRTLENPLAEQLNANLEALRQVMLSSPDNCPVTQLFQKRN